MGIKRVRNIVLAILLSSIFLVVGILIGHNISGTMPSSRLSLYPGVYPGAPSYTVWSEGSNYFAKDAYGNITYSGTDATTVSNHALANGGTIKFLGTFPLTSPLLPANNSYLDLTNAILIQTASSTAYTIFGVFVSNITIYGGRASAIYGPSPSANYNATVIYFLGSRNINIQNVQVDGNHYGIFVDSSGGIYGGGAGGIYQSYDCNIINCYVTNCGSGIVNQAIRGQISGCTVYHCLNEAFCTDGQDIEMANDISDTNGFTGFYIYSNATDIQLINPISKSDNWYSGGGSAGSICVIYSSNVAITGGNVYNGSNNGVVIEASSNVTVQGIISHENRLDGLEISTAYAIPCYSVTYSGCSSFLNGLDGMYVFGNNHFVSLIGNQFYNNGVNGTALRNVGILLQGYNATAWLEHVLISGNQMYDTRSGRTRTQQTGIQVDNFINFITIVDNDVENNAGAAFAMFGTYGSTVTNMTVRELGGWNLTASDVTAGSSPYTFPLQYYDVTYVLYYYASSVSQITLDGKEVGNNVQTNYEVPIFVKANHVLTVTWSGSTAPSFHIIPQP
jgi:hypothetical protein